MIEKYFELAKKQAKKSDHHQHRLGCVIVSKGRVISSGFNQLKTHSKSPHPFKSLHAEIHALLSSPYELLKGSYVYVFRSLKDGTPALARPCPYCEKTLRQSGVEKVFYTCNTGWKEEIYE